MHLETIWGKPRQREVRLELRHHLAAKLSALELPVADSCREDDNAPYRAMLNT